VVSAKSEKKCILGIYDLKMSFHPQIMAKIAILRLQNMLFTKFE